MQTWITRVYNERRSYVFAAIIAPFSILLAYGQDKPAVRLTFDVASINLTKVKLDENKSLIGPLPGGQGVSARNAPIRLLISALYRVPMPQITGGPSWLDTDGYDIEAKVDHSYSPDDLRVMFQNLLADRFKLNFHKEVKEGSVYVLTVDKSGSKLKVNESPEDTTAFPLRSVKDEVYVWERVSMPAFCRWLGPLFQRAERPVIDKTGLDKFYDFKLAFLPPALADSPKENLSPALRDLPSIFDALQDQLGLRLQPQKGPLDYYVIDHVERPAEN
jgi:uncharacterized protein (TIGR03435 family)